MSLDESRSLHANIFRAALACLAGETVDDPDEREIVARRAIGLAEAREVPQPLATGFGDEVYPSVPVRLGPPPIPTASSPTHDALSGLRREARLAIAGPPESFEAELERLGSYVAIGSGPSSRVSLYDGTRLIAGVACALEGGRVEVLRADCSGIQDFIYTIDSKRALVVLRGRSAYIELLLDVTARALATAAGATSSAIVYVGGGNFELILPPSGRDAAIEALSRLNESMYERFGPSIFLAAASVTCAGTDAFSESVRATLGRRLAEAKGQPHRSILQRVLGVQQWLGSGEPCAICRRDVRTDPHELSGVVRPICTTCWQMLRLGQQIGQATAFVNDSAGELDLLLNRYRIVQDRIPAGLSTNDYVVNAFAGGARRFFYAGRRSEGALDLERCAETSGGTIAALRMDVDNLGAFFADAARQSAGPGWIASVSGRLTRLFRLYTGALPQADRFPSASLEGLKAAYAQFVYAGGDDLFLLGAWDAALAFALDFRETLVSYLGLRNRSGVGLGISAGLVTGDPHEPLYRLAEQSLDLESLAKAGGGETKNALALSIGGRAGVRAAHDDASAGDVPELGVRLTWSQWARAIDLALQLLASIEKVEESVSRGFAYTLLSVGLRYADEDVLIFPRLAYAIARLKPQLPRALDAAILDRGNATLLAPIGAIVALQLRGSRMRRAS